MGNEDLNLFYGCDSVKLITPYKQFNCNASGSASGNSSYAYYLIGPVPDPILKIIRCNTSLRIPVLQSAANSLTANNITLGEVLTEEPSVFAVIGFVMYEVFELAPCYSFFFVSDFNCDGLGLMLCNGPGFAADPVFTILSLKMHIRPSILDNLAWTTYMLSAAIFLIDFKPAILLVKVSGCRGQAVIMYQKQLFRIRCSPFGHFPWMSLLFSCPTAKTCIQAKSKDLPTPPSSKGIAPSLTGFSESIPLIPTQSLTLKRGAPTWSSGKLQDGRVVAVKRLYENNFKRVEQFMNEVQILTRLQHQNLVKLYGCTSRRSRELLLVYEYIPNGTVADHLHGKQANSGSITWPVRLSIAIETANALAYLHESEIIHRDVKTNNILLDNNFQVKVADFGLSRLFPTDVTHVSTAPQGTPGYVDPEYHQCYQLTSKSDVYSFGVVLMELISSKQAVDTNRHRHDINLANMAVNKILNHTLHELVDPSLGFESDSLVRRKITLVAELAFRCLQHERDMRPTMGEVLKALRRIENEESDVQKAEEVDINSEDIGLLKSNPPPVSPDSVVADKGVNPTTPYSF
ncbi:Leaf rust 10 disease-resistance locus receptor-like protein kinase-like 1.1-like 1.4 [Vitis vinifera]|uniref:Leaf rust 10 disease-resistance locus receptor-like protein kinase-like 1.1-like 1.4 n=1 Tax=Vitis vinifera TaxID=29760 RepID=A0A438FHY1_VITVI|nr:Leaf rust 10 disease-resistance locus receptor-like protein kinase-like 1.1-like 1.4 [Vitis vinifera]